jgi:hypothetical protein
MTKSIIFKNLLFGFLSWLIPFGISCLFYNRNGELLISYDLFKSLMIVVGSITGCYFLYRYFKILERNYIWNGIIVGLVWFSINIILDIIILIPMMKTTFINYYMAIGLRYTVIIIISITFGYLLHQKRISKTPL